MEHTDRYFVFLLNPHEYHYSGFSWCYKFAKGKDEYSWQEMIDQHLRKQPSFVLHSQAKVFGEYCL